MLISIHKRRHPRKDMNIPCTFECRFFNKAVSSKGAAVIHNISQSGLLLREIRVEEDFSPTKPFFFKINIPQLNLENLDFKCQPMRFGILEKGIEIGLKFFGKQNNSLSKLLGALDIAYIEDEEE